MRKNTMMMATLMAVCLNMNAAEPAKTYKKAGLGNPISASVFCADPTAVEYNGRLYVYGTNDHQQFLVNGKKGSNDYGAIKSLVVFSTDDMVNWTFHGTINAGQICNGWIAASWAPSICYRELEDGTPEFFLYFANSGGSVGVMKSNSPVGPFTSPRKSAMITGSTAGVSPCSWVFDPGVVIDENGTGWIAFGGGDPNKKGTDLQPNNACIAKLQPSMTAIDGKAVKLPAPYHFEASELNIMNGKFVYTYCSSWKDRNAWSQYSSTYQAPDKCTMCYMTTDTPLEPTSWEYKGQYFANPGSMGYNTSNNHTHLHKYEGKYYLFYHTTALEQKMNTGASGFRSIGVNAASVKEDEATISKVTANNSGVTTMKKLNPYILQEAETMGTSGGVTYEDFINIMKISSNPLGNDAAREMMVKMNAGAWTMVRKADFGSKGAAKFRFRAKGTGTMTLRLDAIASVYSTSMDFSSTNFQYFTIDLDHTFFNGDHSTFFFFPEATNVYFDNWQFFRYGDLNCDGQIDVGDIMYIINFMIENSQTEMAEGIKADADLNDDGKVDVGDIMTIINLMSEK